MALSDEIKSTKFESFRSKAIINLFYTANYFRDLHKGVFKKFNLLPQHFNALRIINGRYPDPISPGEIKEVMIDKAPDVTRLVDKLVSMELVNRCQNQDNRRVMEIRISDQGQKLLQEMNEEIDAMTAENFKLTEKEAEQLSDLLDQSRNSKT